MVKQQQDKAFTLRIASATLEKLEQLAERDERSVAYVIRKAIDEYVDRRKKVKP